MEKLLENSRFLDRYFTADEIAYIRSRGKSAAQTMAGLFAARESLGKALGCGIDFDLKEAEVGHSPAGAPFFRLSGKLKERLGTDRILLSITHDGGIAAAVCLVEAGSEGDDAE